MGTSHRRAALVALLSLVGAVAGWVLPGSGALTAVAGTAPAAAVEPPAESLGYWMVTGDGAVFSFGEAPGSGTAGLRDLNGHVVDMASTANQKGYWLAAEDGGVFSYGNARFYGSAGALQLNKPVVGMAATPSGLGYWLVASDGGIFSFGDAKFYGSTGSIKLNQPVVAMAPTASGKGYWLFASDGGVFSFGDAKFYGSTGSIKLNKPVVGAAASPDGAGYWLVATDGGVFTFGSARFFGSTGSLKLNQPVVDMAPTEKGDGYTLVAADGGVFTFGSAPFLGAAGAGSVRAAAVTTPSGAVIGSPVVAMEWFDRYADVQVLAINDFHGNLEPPSGDNGKISGVDAGGAEYLATHVAGKEATNPNTTVVTAGDLIGASPFVSAFFRDEPTIEAMNLIGLDVSAVGNHEFDDGVVELLRMQNGGCHPTEGCFGGDGFGGAEFQYLAANVIDKTTGKTILPAYVVRGYQGARVAYIGMTLEGTPELVTPTGVAGVEFRDEAATVNALVPMLKAAGIETIIVLLHEGGTPATGNTPNECKDITGPIVGIANAIDDEVDAIISGHTHQMYNCVIDGKVVTSAASYGRLLTDVDMRIDKVTGDVVSMTANNGIVTRTVAKAPAITALIDRYKALSKPFESRVIGTQAVDIKRDPLRLSESAMGNLVTDAMRAYYATVDAALTNSGGLRADLLMTAATSGEKVGEITWGEMFSVLPYGNRTVLETVTGAQLRAALLNGLSPVCDSAIHTGRFPQVSGLWIDFTCSGSTPVITSLSKTDGGPQIGDADTVRIVTNDFMYAGGDGYTALTGGTNVGQPGDDLLDVAISYIAAHSPVSKTVEGRIVKAA